MLLLSFIVFCICRAMLGLRISGTEREKKRKVGILPATYHRPRADHIAGTSHSRHLHSIPNIP